MAPPKTSQRMRTLHRYLGFFLAGIMAVYAFSGMVLIFRKTDFLKQEKQIEQKIAANLPAVEVGKNLKIKEFTVDRTEGNIMYFKGGQYNIATGEATKTIKELPYVMKQMTHLHKSTTNDPLFYLNIFFGAALLFFVVSAFWMFRPKTETFQVGLYYTLGGVLLTLIMLFV